MKLFDQTTLQKGLERFLPELTIEETERIYSVLGYRASKGDYTSGNPEKFYLELEKLFRDSSFSPPDEFSELGVSIFRDLQKRSKTYTIPLNPSPNFVRRKRARELDLLKRIVGEKRE